MNSTVRQIIFWIVIIGGAVLLWWFFRGEKETALSYTQLLDKVASEQVKTATIDESKGITGRLASGEKFKTELSNQFVQADIARAMKEKKVEVSFKSAASGQWLTNMLGFVLPMILIIAFWIFMLRQMQSGGGGAPNWVKSRAKPVLKRENLASFQDIAGYWQTKRELGEVIDYLRSPSVFEGLGTEIPRNILLIGPPGTGKTMLTQAIAKSADAPFFLGAGSEFVEMFVGVGASRMRDLFEQAKKELEKQKRPVIIFIDEIDAIARKRATALMHTNIEHDQTLNELLVQLDGFIKTKQPEIIFVAATNREDVLDPAFMQRMNRRIVVHLPTQAERELIIRKHAKGKPFVLSDAEVTETALQAAGFSGRELKDLINEAPRQTYHRLLRQAEQQCDSTARSFQLVCPKNGASVKNPVPFAGTCPPGASLFLKVGGRQISVTDDNEDGIWAATLEMKTGETSVEVFDNCNVKFRVAEEKEVIKLDDVRAALDRLGAAIPKIDDPASVKDELDNRVRGQQEAKQVLAAAAAIHYANARRNLEERYVREVKSNILLVGSTGVGKTHLARSLAHLLKVPFATTDVITLANFQSSASAKQTLLRQLIQTADGNVQKAQYGIVCVQSLDKLTRQGAGLETFWAQQGQETLLDLIKGEQVEVSLTHEAFQSRTVAINTRNVLFICEGDFPRVTQPQDLRSYGFSNELIGYFLTIAALDSLSLEDYQDILDPEWNWSPLREYQNLLRSLGIEIRFSPDGLQQIADDAMARGMGARGIDSVMHGLCLHLLNQGKQSTEIPVDKTFVIGASPRWPGENSATPGGNIGSDLQQKSPSEARKILLGEE